MTKPTSIDEYISRHEEPARSRLRELRRLAQDAAPEATEALKWGSPAYLHASGTILFIYSAHAEHANFTLTPSTREAFVDELTGFGTGKGSVKLPYDAEIPADLLQRMVAYRIHEFEEGGVLWM